MFDTFKNRLEITGKLTTITALRISAGRSSEPIGSDLPVIKDSLGNPLIPGSSFKGAMRSRLESFLRGINPNLAANPAIEAEWSITSQAIKQLKEDYYNDEAFTQELIAQTDLTSLVFGSPWIASKFQVRDLTVVPDTWFGQYQERDGVAIDRDTETAADGKLYDFQVVPAGTQFEFKAVVENAEDYELGLLMIGLHQFETEQIPLGGGRSRGLGVVKLDIDKMTWIDVDNNPEKLLKYLQTLVNEDTSDTSIYEDGKPFKNTWTQDLINHLSDKLAENSTQSIPSGG
ncbi:MULTISPECIES: type III CRISPR-associated RAMP protein Csx7 [unclassified Tolypothrix]|uniref:type III CRISPR-associated RAMP protein Csx7 n=1 Tax=unclassified Tolypothrix TaxID=2649714 RepID=UPI0005EAB507|nr:MULTISPECIES: CRISPR-associated RAMP protein Csx7 [unclassified Tolypothrix]BAY92689.1 SSO1426 family CRISPR-associated RAMP protein [Microchaete diplosiphon NIES-3275]EKF05795.1 putative CRISPR-associated protein [Tolypothrix sp. PCC 7601]MBE9081456.1 CRISPR-associated RAMP protein [Tolypothrix sp. LEGE 11397]UYD26628.1 CRISPR-associated RAMP protein [Tolypothrix sp. PCC 7712]UYD37515.1 CRISPR-associated RAMP protein [Tolypothrix sp. PCC 7601]